VGGASTNSLAEEYAALPPIPTPPRHAQERVEGGEKGIASPYAFGIRPRRLAMILSTIRLGSIDPISCWTGSGVIW
jgi:hypothetical protein